MDLPLGPRDISKCFDLGWVRTFLVPEVISLILKLGAMMALIKGGFMSIKNGTLTARQQGYSDVHGWYRAHIE